MFTFCAVIATPDFFAATPIVARFLAPRVAYQPSSCPPCAVKTVVCGCAVKVAGARKSALEHGHVAR